MKIEKLEETVLKAMRHGQDITLDGRPRIMRSKKVWGGLTVVLVDALRCKKRWIASLVDYDKMKVIDAFTYYRDDVAVDSDVVLRSAAERLQQDPASHYDKC